MVGELIMFEDIIRDNKEKPNINHNIDPDVCPHCYSLDIEDDGGVFISSTVYVQSMKCNTCKKEWSIHFNQNLNVISIDY